MKVAKKVWCSYAEGPTPIFTDDAGRARHWRKFGWVIHCYVLETKPKKRKRRKAGKSK